MDSYKERDTGFVKSAVAMGELNYLAATLCLLLPKSWALFFGLQPFQAKPIDYMGNYFKKLLRERKRSGVKYNDLSEALVNAVGDNKVVMSEDEVVGNILLAFFGGELL